MWTLSLQDLFRQTTKLTFSLEVKSSKLKRQVLLGLTQSHVFDTLCHTIYMSRTGICDFKNV